MKNKWILWLVLTGMLLLAAYSLWNDYRPSFFGPGFKYVEIPVDPNDWKALKFVETNDTTHVYKVTWSQSWGAPMTAYCKAIFINDKSRQYRLVAPWFSAIDLERANIDDIKFELVPLDSTVLAVIDE
jgi:hypothetical protein